MRFAPDLEQRIKALSAGDQLKAKELLQQYQLHRAQNPLQFFVPHQGQTPFFESTANIRALMGGNRSGKTTAGVVDNLIQAAPRELLPDHLLGYKRWECPFYCRIVIPDLKRHLQDVLLQKLREWTPKDMLRNGSLDASYSNKNEQLRFECGCRFDVMSFEQELDKFGGSALHRCHYDEEPPEDIREECRMRLADFDGDELFTMTPLKGMTWMYDGIYEAAATDPDIDVQLVDMDDNPHLSERGKQRAVKGLTDAKREARKKGRMVHFEGMVYPTFEDSKVTVLDDRLVRSLEVVVGIDPGIRTAAVSFVGFDRENNAAVFDELYLHDHNVPDQCRLIREKVKHWGLDESKLMYVIDPAARQRTLTEGVRVETAYHNEGIYPAHGQNDPLGGAAIIRSRLDRNALQVAANCTWHFWEAKRYRRQFLEDSGQWRIMPSDHDHIMDSLRYAITLRPWEYTNLEVDTDSPKVRRERWKSDSEVAFPPEAIKGNRQGRKIRMHA